ncbi:hypothetical protein B6I21_00920 [candidate division KSB1 bacterium 4572_119]|nr:MAG: hypothetical protein B6I21_00920 [candidate division KSB1 bacterium 4572_119]
MKMGKEMFKKLKFRSKVLIIPALASSVLILILIVTLVLSGMNKKLLEKIENGYYPSVELSRDLEEILNAIQQGMQDAVAISDEEALAETDTLYDRFINRVESQIGNPLIDADELKQLKSEFQDYYNFAREVVGKIIRGETDEEGVASIGVMLKKFNAINDKLISNTKNDKSQISIAFSSTKKNYNVSILITILSSTVFILLVIVLAIILSKSITEPVAEVVRAANEFISGNPNTKVHVNSSDEIGELGQAINNMIDSIVTSNAEIERQNWVKTGQTELNDKMRGELDHVTLAQNAINYLAEYLNAQIGAIYLNTNNNKFKLVGSYAYSKRKNLSNEYKKGEGIIGQAAMEKKSILITDIPDDYIKINSGLGEAAPKNILAVPFMYEDEVKGVVELGSFREFSDTSIEFLKQATENIGINFNSAESRYRLQELLEKTQQQAEELQSQQEELRQTNEELEEQAKYLKESEAKLQTQQEELKQTNEELEEKTQSLQEQKENIDKKNIDLKKAQDLLEQRANELEISSKYKSEFLANMSHELRTPLNSLLILSKILFQNKDQNLTDKQVEFAQTIHDAGNELLNIINEILDLAKVESGKMARLLRGEIHLRSEEGKGSTFTLFLSDLTEEKRDFASIDNQTEKVHSSPTKLAAPKSTGAKEEIILPDDRETLKESDHTILIVEDDVKFARILTDLAHERDFKCLVAQRGEMGLQFAEKYKPDAIILDIGLPDIDGWTVMERLKNNPGTRHIPVHFMSASDKTMEAMRMGAIGFLSKPVSMEGLEGAFTRIEAIISKTIKNLLVVEDDEAQRKSIIELIGNSDVRTTAIESGKKAYDLLKTNNYDCMVLDLGLEDISGFELLRMIEADEEITHIPIIIYTGKEISRKEEEKLKQHAESIIIKGVKSPDRLFDEVTLFLHRVEANLPEDKQKILRMIHDKETLFQDKKILLVDDDMRNVFALSNVLEEKGMKVLIGKNGREGVDLLNENKDVDLVLMDIMMPEMDGYQAMREIRNNGGHNNVPIIALTAKAMKGDKNKCIEAGANDYISKPVDPDNLLSMLRVWLYR